MLLWRKIATNNFLYSCNLFSSNHSELLVYSSIPFSSIPLSPSPLFMQTVPFYLSHPEHFVLLPNIILSHCIVLNDLNILQGETTKPTQLNIGALFRVLYMCCLLIMPASHCTEIDSWWTTEYNILKFLFLVYYLFLCVLNLCQIFISIFGCPLAVNVWCQH